MNKRKLGSFVLCVMLLALCASAEAQQPKKVPRIGWLSIAPLSANADRIEAFRKGLREILGGEKHCDRVAICRGETRSSQRTCGRANASQGRRNRHGRFFSHPLCQASNCCDSHRHGV